MLNLSLLAPHETYLVGLSGGRDSVCLLHLLLEHGIKKLHLVHLNHQLREQQSASDADFVKSLANRLDLPLTLAERPVAQIAGRDKLSLEAAARQCRHQLFAQVAQASGIPRLLLAHHAEDQAETILFNLLRGASGCIGMEALKTLQVGEVRLEVIRPLLTARRVEIDAFLTEREIPFCEDSSNRDPAYTRNRLRHEVLPLLAEVMGRDVVPSLLRAAERTREREGIVEDLLGTLQLLDPEGRLYLPKLRLLSRELQGACLKQFLSHHAVTNISQDLLFRAQRLVSPDGPPELNLPGNRFLRRREGRIFFR